MLTRCSTIIGMSLLVSAVVLTGCAKRPATTAAAAPAPTGSSGTSGTGSTGSTGTGSGSQMQPGSGGAMTQPGSGGTTTPGGGGTGTQAPGSAARPAIRDFAADSNLGDIFFDFDKYDIRQTDARTLDGNAQWLKSNPNHLILIEGHCDERGTNEYNLALGERRAAATREYLVSLGIPADRIQTVSKGEESPFCTEENESCWQQNRRGHFIITAK